MFIKALEYDAIVYIKNNLKTIHNQLQTNSFEKIFEQIFGIDWYKPSKILKPDIYFVMTEKEPKKKKNTDFENSIMIYNLLKNLTESQASDERLWAGLAIEPKFYEYLKYRWEDTENTIRYRVVYHTSGKRGVMYHGLGRLWWFAHITYDEKRDDHFELTKFAFEYPHILEKMIYRNFSNSKSIRVGIIEGIKDYVTLGGDYKIKKIDELYKHISTIGSVNLIDSFSKEEIRKITLNNLLDYDKNN